MRLLIAKRVDVLPFASFHRMTFAEIDCLDDPNDVPPLGNPWDALRIAAQTWTHEYRRMPLSQIQEIR